MLKGISMRHNGFTLIEMVIGIVTLAVAMVFFTSAYLPLATRSVDPLLEMKASELASALFSELRSKRFDEQSDPDGGIVRCGEQGTVCTVEANFGKDSGESSRVDFDDIDDYHNLSLQGDAIASITGAPIVGKYRDYTLDMQVRYSGSVLGMPNNAAKQIVLTITLPKGDTLQFSTIRSNY